MTEIDQAIVKASEDTSKFKKSVTVKINNDLQMKLRSFMTTYVQEINTGDIHGYLNRFTHDMERTTHNNGKVSKQNRDEHWKRIQDIWHKVDIFMKHENYDFYKNLNNEICVSYNFCFECDIKPNHKLMRGCYKWILRRAVNGYAEGKKELKFRMNSSGIIQIFHERVSVTCQQGNCLYM